MPRLQSVLSIVLLLVAFPVFPESVEDNPVYSLPTIVITPEWREVDLQRDPSTVNMLSGQQLDAANIDNARELQYALPGLAFSSSPGVGVPYLRGVGGVVSAAGGSSVSTFVDGVYMSRVGQSLQELFDIDRIEVIKGPRGVHLGRNVVGGALSIITQDPRPYREAYADALYGSRNQRQLRGAINLPIPDSDLSFRLAGTMTKRDGYSRDVSRGEDLDDKDYYAWRGKLRYRPSADLDIILSAARSRQDDTSGLAKQPDPDVGVNGGILLGGVVFDNPHKVTRSLDENQNIKNGLYSAKILWNTGALDVQSLTAYQDRDLEMAIDLDGTDADFASNFPASNAHAVSQEFRVGSKQDRDFTWVAGVYYLYEDASQELDVRFPLTAVQNRPESDTRNTSWAAFGELAYSFTPAWQGRAGLRYSYDESKLDLEQTIADPFGVTGPAGTSTARSKLEDHWDAVTPEFGVTFTPSQNTLYYANVSRGYKAGGYSAYSIQPAYDPEYLWAYETGMKKTFPGQNLRINAALFYYDYKGIQLLTLPPGAPPGTLLIITNAARATVKGLDLQAWYQPVWNLELSAGATLLDAQFDEFDSVDPNNPATDPDRSGDPLPQAPDVSLVLGSAYRWVLPRYGDMKLSADYRYQSAVYFNPYKDQAVRQDAYGLVNASLGFYSRKDNWYAELYANNLTDKLYAQNIIRVDPVAGTVRYWGEPRTFGLRLGYRL